MNPTIHPDTVSEVPWPTSVPRVPAPDTSMLPGGESPGPAAVGLLKQAVQGAHDTIDRLADAASPAVQQLDENVAAAAEAVTVKAHQLRETRDAWLDGARTTVRRHPLTAVAAAFALGAVMVRMARIGR